MKSILALLFGITLAVHTCEFPESHCNPNDDSDPAHQTEATYEIGVGEKFEIALISNPTTGYSWIWSNRDLVSIVDSIGYKFVVDTPTFTGTGGTDYWKFKGVETGYDSLIFEYCRSWEENSTIETKTFTVRVD